MKHAIVERWFPALVNIHCDAPPPGDGAVDGIACLAARRLAGLSWFLLVLVTGVSPNAGGSQGGRLAIKVRADGQAAPQLYLAVVRDDQPLSAPVDESMTTKTERVLPLAVGRYRVIAGGIGYATSHGNVVDIAAGETTTVLLTLAPLAAVSGRIVDSEGNPIEGARVGLPGSFRLDYPDKLSPFAEAELRSNTLSTTDQAGSFLLPVQGVGTSFIFVEADGFSPAMLAGVKAANAGVGDVRLQSGAILDATWQAPISGFDRVQLFPRHVALPPTLTFSGAVGLWARPAMAGAARWPSLYPGTYDICFAETDAEPPVAPRCVTRVKLRAGARVSVKLANAPSPSVPATLPVARDGPAKSRHETEITRARIALRLQHASGVALPQAAAVELTACDDASRGVETVSFRVGPDGVADVPVPAGCFLPTVHSGTFASVRLSRVEVNPGDVLHLPLVRLRPGATLTTRVVDAADRPVPEARVLLLRTEDVDAAASHTERARVSRKAQTDALGWVKLIGIPEDKYVLVVTRAAREPLVTAAFAIRPQEQFFLNDIVLPPDE